MYRTGDESCTGIGLLVYRSNISGKVEGLCRANWTAMYVSSSFGVRNTGGCFIIL